MSGPESALTYRAARWRAWVAWGHLVAVAIGVALLMAFNLHRGPVILIWLGLLLLPVLLLVAGQRPVRVYPGSRLERPRLFRRPLVVPAGPGTDLLYYPNVRGTHLPIRPLDSPIGVVDQRWAVLRREGRVVLRFPMRLWALETVDELTLRLGFEMTYDPTFIEPATVAKRHPDYYWRIEQRPRLYLTLSIIAMFAMALWIMASFFLPFILSQIWGTA